MTCRECGEPIGDNVSMCAHCTIEYMRENNSRFDALKELDLASFDLAMERLDEGITELKKLQGLDHIFNRGI